MRKDRTKKEWSRFGSPSWWEGSWTWAIGRRAITRLWGWEGENAEFGSGQDWRLEGEEGHLFVKPRQHHTRVLPCCLSTSHGKGSFYISYFLPWTGLNEILHIYVSATRFLIARTFHHHKHSLLPSGGQHHMQNSLITNEQHTYQSTLLTTTHGRRTTTNTLRTSFFSLHSCLLAFVPA